MLRKRQVITMVSVAVISFLIGTTFNVITMATDGGNPFDNIWEAIEAIQGTIADMEGRVENLEWWADTHEQAIDELTSVMQGLIYSVGAHEEAIDDLQSRVEALEEQSIPQGFVSTPAYDSGWITIPENTFSYLEHNLDTSNLFVYVLGENDEQRTHQAGLNDISPLSLSWECNSTTIRLERGSNTISRWDYIRVMIWRLPEPPT